MTTLQNTTKEKITVEQILERIELMRYKDAKISDKEVKMLSLGVVYRDAKGQLAIYHNYMNGDAFSRIMIDEIWHGQTND